MSYITYEVRVFSDGDKYWYQYGKLHRTDGPTIECTDGHKEWYQNGQRHRTDGPAVEYSDGYKAWYKNGKLHRTDGPARQYSDGAKFWYLEGNQLTEAEFNARTKPSCSGKVVEIDGKKYKLVELS